jgi:hypothetical protein
MGKDTDQHLELQDVWLKCTACGAEAYVYLGHGRLSKVQCTQCWKVGHVRIKPTPAGQKPPPGAQTRRG